MITVKTETWKSEIHSIMIQAYKVEGKLTAISSMNVNTGEAMIICALEQPLWAQAPEDTELYHSFSEELPAMLLDLLAAHQAVSVITI